MALYLTYLSFTLVRKDRNLFIKINKMINFCLRPKLSRDLTVTLLWEWFFLFLKRIVIVWGLKYLFLFCIACCISSGLHHKSLRNINGFTVWNLCCTCRRWACSLWLSCSLAPEQTSAQSQTSSLPCQGGKQSRRCTWPSTAHPLSGQASLSQLWKCQNKSWHEGIWENAVTPALMHHRKQQNNRKKIIFRG